MRKLILVVFGVLVIGAAFAPIKQSAVTAACANCCSWSSECEMGFKCCNQASPCSTEPLRYGTCLKVKVCVQPPNEPELSYVEDWRVGTRDSAQPTGDLEDDPGRSGERAEEFTPVIDPEP